MSGATSVESRPNPTYAARSHDVARATTWSSRSYSSTRPKKRFSREARVRRCPSVALRLASRASTMASCSSRGAPRKDEFTTAEGLPNGVAVSTYE